MAKCRGHHYLTWVNATSLTTRCRIKVSFLKATAICIFYYGTCLKFWVCAFRTTLLCADRRSISSAASPSQSCQHTGGKGTDRPVSLFLLWDHLQTNSVEKSLHEKCKGLQLCLLPVRSGIGWSDGGGKEMRLGDWLIQNLVWPHIHGSSMTLGAVTLTPELTSSLSCKPFVKTVKCYPMDTSLLWQVTTAT